MATKVVVQELISRWRYKVDASEIKKTAAAIRNLKGNISSVRKSSLAFTKSEFYRIGKIKEGWRGLNQQLLNYRRNLDRPTRGGLGMGGGLGVGGGKGTGRASFSQSASFLAGRLTGSTALTSALLGGAGLVGTLGIGAALKKAGERQRQEEAYTGLLGGGQEGRGRATNLLDSLNEFAKQTPFQIDDLRELARQSLGGGIAQSEIIPQLRVLGDVTSGNIVYLRRMLDNMIEIKNTQRANLRDIRQFGRVGIPIYEALSAVLGVSGEALAKLISKGKIGFTEVNKALKFLTKEGGRFNKAMERQMKTLLGQASNLADVLIVIAERIGAPLLKPATQLIQALKSGLEGLTPSLENFAQGFSGVIETFAFYFKNSDFAKFGIYAAMSAGILKLAHSMRILNRSMVGFIAFFLILEDFGVYLKGGKSVIGEFLILFDKLSELDFGAVLLGGWMSFVEVLKDFGNFLSTKGGKVLKDFFSEKLFQKLEPLGGATSLPSYAPPAVGGLGSNSDQTFNNRTNIYMQPQDQLPTILEQINDGIFSQERRARRLYEA